MKSRPSLPRGGMLANGRGMTGDWSLRKEKDLYRWQRCERSEQDGRERKRSDVGGWEHVERASVRPAFQRFHPAHTGVSSPFGGLDRNSVSAPSQPVVVGGASRQHPLVAHFKSISSQPPVGTVYPRGAPDSDIRDADLVDCSQLHAVETRLLSPRGSSGYLLPARVTGGCEISQLFRVSSSVAHSFDAPLRPFCSAEPEKWPVQDIPPVVALGRSAR